LLAVIPSHGVVKIGFDTRMESNWTHQRRFAATRAINSSSVKAAPGLS
jgi:hypothetical protein